jgi:hypothetical protein
VAKSLKSKELNEHLYKLTQHATIGLKNRLMTPLLLLDVEKAFDSVWHNRLRYKLAKLGINHNLLRLLSSFLNNRFIQERVGGHLSNKVNLVAGTPQGLVLSPILFILYVNDLPVNPGIYVTQYADDLGIYLSERNTNYARIKLQNQLRRLESW